MSHWLPEVQCAVPPTTSRPLEEPPSVKVVRTNETICCTHRPAPSLPEAQGRHRSHLKESKTEAVTPPNIRHKHRPTTSNQGRKGGRKGIYSRVNVRHKTIGVPVPGFSAYSRSSLASGGAPVNENRMQRTSIDISRECCCAWMPFPPTLWISAVAQLDKPLILTHWQLQHTIAVKVTVKMLYI